MNRRILLLAAVLLGAGACKSGPRDMSVTTPGSAGPAYGGGMATGTISEEPDEVGRSVSDDSAPRLEAKRVRARRFARKDKAAEAPPPPVGATASPARPKPAVDAPDPSGGEPSVGAGGAEPAVANPDPAKTGRQIIYTASMTVSVFNLEKGMRAAEGLAERHGGYIQSMTEGLLVLRVPASKLRSAMNELGEMGVVESRTLQSQDVTAEYVDLESRIRVLKQTQTQLLELLTKARTVEEALRVRQALDQITMELEVNLGRMRQLNNMIGYSTLSISLVERGPHLQTPSSNDPFPWVDDLGVEATEWK